MGNRRELFGCRHLGEDLSPTYCRRARAIVDFGDSSKLFIHEIMSAYRTYTFSALSPLFPLSFSMRISGLWVLVPFRLYDL
jgi:hypothetical protein